MAISFQSHDEVLRKLRDRLRKMTDEEFIRFGKEVRRLAENPFQLSEARAERLLDGPPRAPTWSDVSPPLPGALP
jgi:hypothetical protein